MDLEALPQKRRKVDSEHCIICFKSLINKDGPVIKNPRPEGLRAILTCSSTRKDEVYDALWELRDDILSLKLKVSFHISCRANYASKSNVRSVSTDHADCTEKLGTSCSSVPGPSTKTSRGQSLGFNIRTDCFICGQANRRGEKLTQVCTGTGEATREKVLSAAAEINDSVTHLRMISCPDLFAYDAKYHRSCYGHYVSERNVAAAKRRVEDKDVSKFDQAFKNLIEHLETTIFSTRKTVMSLANLRLKFVQLLGDTGVASADQYKSWKLKERLKTHYGDRLVFVSFHGHTDILCSSSVSVGDALWKAYELENTNKPDISEEYIEFDQPPLNEQQTLHTAAGILRKHMSEIENTPNLYQSPEDLDMRKCAETIPDIMYDFVRWCVSEKSYKNLISCTDQDTDQKDNLRVIAICHDLISQSRNIRTAKTLGLALQIHHDLGSKHLIYVLFSLGHCVSYDEVRRFLTSVAIEEINDAKDVYVPKVLQNLASADGTPIIDAAIDNFDQNESTLDGKTTTHAMAAVLYHRGGTPKEGHQILRLGKKALLTSDITFDAGSDSLHRYSKPSKRPEPPILHESAVTAINAESSDVAKADRRDLAWKLARSGIDEKQCVPSWNGYNAFLSTHTQSLATIHYLPFIQAPPTDSTTINTILVNLVHISAKLGQTHTLVTADYVAKHNRLSGTTLQHFREESP